MATNRQINIQVSAQGTQTVQQQIQGIGQSVQGVEESTGKLAKAFSGMGLALKAAGIGLLLQAWSTIKDVFMSNQTAVDAVSTSMNFLTIVTTDVIEIIKKSINTVAGSSNGFENLTKTIGGLITISLTPLRMVLNSLRIAFDAISLAWEQGPFGKDRPERVAQLKQDIVDAGTGMYEIGKNAVQAGVNIATSLPGAIGEVSDVIKDASDNIQKLKLDAIAKQAADLTEIENVAKKLEVANQGVVAQYQLEIDLQKEIRGDTSKSFLERIEANTKIGKSLDDQNRIMQANAAIMKNAANARFEALPNLENEIKLKTAINAADEISHGVERKKVSQIKESILLWNEYRQSLIDANKADSDLTISHEKFTNSLITNNQDRLESVKKTLKDEYEANRKNLMEQELAYVDDYQKQEKIKQELAALNEKYFQDTITANRAAEKQKSEDIIAASERIINNQGSWLEQKIAAYNTEEDAYKTMLDKKLISDIDYHNKVEDLEIKKKTAIIENGKEELDYNIGRDAIYYSSKADSFDKLRAMNDKELANNLENQDKHDQKEKELNDKQAQAKKDYYDNIASMADSAMNSITQLVDAAYQAEINNVDKALSKSTKARAKELEQAKGNKAKEAEINNKYDEVDEALAKKKAKLEHDQAVKDKELKLILAVINTALAVTSALTSTPPASFIMAALALAAGLAEVVTIASTKIPDGDSTSAASTGGGSGSGSSPAQFNVVGTSSNNQLAQTISGEQNKPIKAYVVSNEVTTAQSLDRNKVDTATFGK